MKKRDQAYIDKVYSSYKTVDYSSTTYFNIIHLHNSKKSAHPNGHFDANWITVKCYNTETKEMFTLPRLQDMLSLSYAIVSSVKIFLDGSTLIDLSGNHKIGSLCQASRVEYVRG
jgi:hypothetical protein